MTSTARRAEPDGHETLPAAGGEDVGGALDEGGVVSAGGVAGTDGAGVGAPEVAAGAAAAGGPDPGSTVGDVFFATAVFFAFLHTVTVLRPRRLLVQLFFATAVFFAFLHTVTVLRPRRLLVQRLALWLDDPGLRTTADAPPGDTAPHAAHATMSTTILRSTRAIVSHTG